MGIHSCNHCNYTSDRLYNLKVHVRNKHGNNKNEMYVGNNAPPPTINTHPRSGNIITNEPNLQCESGPSQVYNAPAKTVSIEDYNKANESAHGWKSAYDNLYNQTGSGIFTQGDIDEVHKHGVEAIKKWEIALGKEKENNKQLKEELHYEKLAKEALPIHMNDKYLNIISILRGVKKGDNMGYYPNKMIHCICEALHNICWNADVIVKGLMKYKFKHELLPIKNYIKRLANPKYSMKKKRQILSKQKVEKGVFTAIASFVIPAFLSILINVSNLSI